MAGCEYFDRDYKVRVVDLRRLEDLYEGQIQKLERSTTLRLKKSVMGEARVSCACWSSLLYEINCQFLF